MTSRAAENLGNGLERERVGRFVGREAELALFSTWLGVASSMVQNALCEHPDDRPDQVLRTLILEAAQILKSDPRAGTQFRVLDRTYLQPAPSQEKAAELLDLPFSTYRRYRDRGIETITDWLWDRDIESGSRD